MFYKIPTDQICTIKRALLAPHHREASGYIYSHSTTAIHLYLYHAEIGIGKDSYRIKPGDITITPPFTEAKYSLIEDGKHWCIHFESPQEHQNNYIKLPLHFSLGKYFDHGTERFRHIASTFNLPITGKLTDKLRNKESSHLFHAMLIWLRRIQETDTRQAKGRHSQHGIAKMLEYIDENLEQNFSSESLCRIADLSHNYLARCFKKQYNLTIPQYIMKRRIERACELMEITQSPIKSIARQVGLADLQYFNKSFRKHTGQSPRSFKLATAKKREMALMPSPRG